MDLEKIKKTQFYYVIVELIERIETLEKEVKRLEDDKANRKGPKIQKNSISCQLS